MNASQLICLCCNLLMAAGSCAYQRKVLLLTINLSRLLKRQSVITVRDQACAECRNIYRLQTVVKWPCVFFLIHGFWLSLITPSKCSETTHRIFQAHARWLRSHSSNFFLLFISFIASICTIQLMRFSIPFITVIYTVILKMKLCVM